MSESTAPAVMSGGEALVRAVRANGVQTVFGLPGAQTYALFDALARLGLRTLVPRHEQAAGYMAMGFAKSTGRPGVFTVVPGPGVLNASAALVTAMGNCSPVVCLTGQVPSEYLGIGRGHLHELADQRATLATLIKDAVRIDDARATSAVVDRAFRTALSDRPGPVAVEMCWDTMASESAIAIEAGNAGRDRPALDLDAVRRAADVIAAARNPMIMCGAGAQHARASVLALAERLEAPVTAFRSGRGVIPEDHALFAGAVAARELFDDVDVLIGIGSRLEMPFMRWRDPMRYERRPASAPTLVRIDVDAGELERLVPDVGVVGDAEDACSALVEQLGHAPRPDPRRREQIAAAKRLARGLIDGIQPQQAYLDTIRQRLPRDGFLVPELSQVGFTTYTGGYEVYEPRTYVTEGFQGTLGFGFPTALGVKAAHPDRAVISVTGDGGFMFAVQELATAAEHGLGVVTLLFNNESYGNVLRDQQQQFGGREIASRLRAPDFMKLAEGFGVAGRRVRSPAALGPVLERALADDAPALIEIVVPAGAEVSPWPLIHMTERPSRLARSSAR